MKIITVVGARPQFIKAAVVGRALSARAGIRELILHTGQHFDTNMSDVFFTELGIPKPAFHLDIHGQNHGAMTGRMLESIESVLIKERPDWVLVYGDTNSTLAGALVAAKLHIPVAHVEAGLRSFNMRMPEEINRVLTDHVADVLFAPTEEAARHLAHEGISKDKIFVVGDVMFDASLYYAVQAKQKSEILARLGLEPSRFVLVTVHRQENTDDLSRLEVIVSALKEIGRNHEVVWPVHPRTKKRLEDQGWAKNVASGIQLIDPVGYLDMVMLEKHASVIATDSGGVQKEAFFYGVPCVTLRDETEWTELVESGWNKLTPPQTINGVVSSITAAIGSRGRPVQPYGDGQAAQKIADWLEKQYLLST
jgi:UDP-GlcNAc3NAcA epimerase